MANELFKKIAEATGLPNDLITKELNEIVGGKGLQSDEVTLDELRLAMAEYLREVILQAKYKFEDGVEIEEEVPPEELGKE
jgi:hypothetical protein